MSALNTTTLLSPVKMSLQRSRTRDQSVWTEDEVRQQLDVVFTSSAKDPAKVVRQIIDSCKTPDKESCLKALFEKYIEALNSNSLLTQQVAKEITGKLLFEVDSMSGMSQVEIAESLIKGLKDGKHLALELFPKVLACIAAKKVIQFKKAGGESCEMVGVEEKNHLLNSLFGCHWEPSSVLHVADMCKDIPMDDEELKFLILKILEMMKTLDLSEIPPLVYQLLSISKKGHKTMILEGIKALFNSLDEKFLGVEDKSEGSVTTGNEKELLATEATVIVHMTFALKQDPELRKEYHKCLKVAQSRLSPTDLTLFSLSLVLSVASIHRLEEMVFGFFKDVVLRAFKDEERRHSSRWIQDVGEDQLNIEQLMFEIVKHSTSGWDQVLYGLVSVGFHLMETYGPKNSTPSQCGSPQQKACSLGTKILSLVFKKHSMVHRDVMSQIINRIMVNSSTYIGHYIELLSEVMRTTSQVDLMRSLPKLKESLSYIAFLPSSSAVDFLTAILPLVEFSSSLRDSLLLVLRKALFSRQVDARKTAVSGYILLLRKFTVLDSLALRDSQDSFSSGSQVSVEVHGGGSSNRHSNEALCLEILGTLRRSLTKQYDVRLSLYEGLHSVFGANDKLSEPILDLLVGHFVKFYEQDADITPPIKLDACILVGDENVIAVEPLDHLISCMQICLCIYLKKQAQLEADKDDTEEGEAPAIIKEVETILASLVERMCLSELDDFDLSKSSDFSVSSVGCKNKLFAKLAMGTYETLLEYTFTAGEFRRERCEQILNLYYGYQRLSDIAQDKGSSGGGRGSGGGSSLRSILSMECVSRLLRALFSDQSPNHQQSLTLLRDSQSFMKYILGVALQQVHQVYSKGSCDGGFVQYKVHKQRKTCYSLARLLFKQTDGSIVWSKKEKGKSLAVMCLQGFSELLHTAVISWNETDSFLTAVNPNVSDGATTNEKIHFFVTYFQGIVTKLLDGTSKDWSSKEAQVMVTMMDLLASKLEPQSQELEQLYHWTYQQCQHHNPDDSFITKSLVSLLLTLSERCKSSIKIIRKLSQDVHYNLGDVDQDIDLDANPHFAIVNPRTTVSSILGLLYCRLETVLDSSEWLIARLKSDVTADSAEDVFEVRRTQEGVGGTQAKDMCSSVCDRLFHIVTACNDLAQSAIPAGPSTEGLLKTFIKLFTTLGSLAKYVLTVHQHTLSIQPEFRKLVNLVGSHLSQQVYLFITFIQTAQVPVGGAGGSDYEKGKKRGKGKPKGTASGKTVVRKETRSFPNLIYSMEQFEKFLIQLDKKAKTNLMEPFKTSTARDFRINAQTVENILDEENVNEGDSDGEDEVVVNGCGPPMAKLFKMT